MSLQSGFYVNEQRALVQNEARGAEGNVKAARLTEKKKKKKHLTGQKTNRGELLKRMTRSLAVNVRR